MQKAVALLVGVFAVTAWAASPQDACLLEQLARAEPDTTARQIRQACLETAPVDEPHPAVISRRLEEEAKAYTRGYAITAHRMNYILPVAYDQHRPGNETFSREVEGEGVRSQKVEAKFQLSLKFPLLLDAFGGKGELFAGYTQRSFWQMYNSAASKPFRETNYEPEIWYQHPLNQQWFGWHLVSASIGLNHQSNGRAQEYSRSWNRVMGSLIFERGEYGLMLRPWWRLKENPDNDDNPDMSHYMGHFDLSLGRKLGRHSFDLVLRNNLKSERNRGAIRLGWSFPLPYTPRMRGYVQWFNGYGESLFDYNMRQNTLGLGVVLADW